MVKTRVCYGLWVLASAVVYLFSESHRAFFLLIISLLMLGWCAITILLTRKRLEYSFQMKRMASKKESVSGLLCIHNHGILPVGKAVCTILFRNQLTGEASRKKIGCMVRGKQREELIWDLDSKYCGRIRAVLEKVECYDWFGIFRWTDQPHISENTVVLPNIFYSEVVVSESFSANWESITYSSLIKGDDPGEIYGLREYVPGDSLKNIHWKLSSKLDEFYVKELSLPIENSILLIYETGILGETEEYQIRDAMMEAFLSISQSLIEQGHTHALGWYDQKRERFCCEEVTSMDELAGMTGGLLALECKENHHCGLHYYFREQINNPFSHVIYITSGILEDEVEPLRSSCLLTVLHCLKDTETKSQDSGQIIFTADCIEDDLCQVVV